MDYEKLPSFGTNCKVIGHMIHNCNKLYDVNGPWLGNGKDEKYKKQSKISDTTDQNIGIGKTDKGKKS